MDSGEGWRECPQFDCRLCARHLILICGERPADDICYLCKSVPGWYRDATLRRMLGMDDDDAPREH